MASTFEKSLPERVKQIEGYFDDPTKLPDTFVSWIPSFVETSGIQIPASQLVGQNVTAPTASQLGGTINGRSGTVRGGSSPYDFTQLVYDSVYGHHVSDQFVVVTMRYAPFGTASTTYDNITECNLGMIPWRSFDTSGLKPQFRLMGILNNAGAYTSSLALAFQTTSSGAVLGTAVTGASIDHTGTAVNFYDQNWTDIPAITVNDFLLMLPVLKTSNAAGLAQVAGVTVWQRWVSK